MRLDPPQQRIADWLRVSADVGGNSPGCSIPLAVGDMSFAEDVCRVGLAGIVLEQAAKLEISLSFASVARLRAAAAAVAAANIHALHELELLVAALRGANVDVMLLKGAALHRTLYDRADLRPMSDLDLLVPPRQVGRVNEVLHALGCTRGRALMRDDFFPKYHYEAEWLTNSPRPARIDLHARPFRPLRISQTMPDEALWAGARWVSCGRADVAIPRPEFMFIHLAAHAVFHGCRRLLWLYDLKRLYEREGQGLDWELVVDRCRAWRLALPVLRAVQRTEECLGQTFPSRLRADLERSPCTWRDRLTLAHAPRDAGSPVVHVALNLLCTPGLRFRIGYLLAHAFPGRGHLAEIYPHRHPGWAAAAWLWRLGRAIGRVAGLVLIPFVVAARICKRIAQPRSSVSIGSSGIHGSGVFARRAIPAGAVIGHYRGRRTEVGGRYAVTRERANGDRHFYDLRPPFRFLNHCEHPNAEVSKSSNVVRAIENIPLGSEITIDYGAEMSFCEECGHEHLVPRSLVQRVDDSPIPLERVA